jgi:beta-lactamase class A
MTRHWIAAPLLALTGPAPLAAQQTSDALRARVEARVQESGAEVGVAFRTLDRRDELLLRVDTPFHAASTMKVPVLIELYRQIDAGRLTLDDQLPVVNRFTSVVDGSPYALDPADDSDNGAIYEKLGGTLPIRELAEAMITVSSNLATNLLIEKLGVANIQQTVARLDADGMKVVRGVEDQKAFEQGLINTTTARALLTLFEAIGRGTAASEASCGELIAILRRQQFNDRIPAGLPPGTPVAHKTGEITRIHHDAGIVYARRPYALVVLVRGLDDSKQAAALIADISRMVYDEVTSRR